jgi:beta-barrel assembly-enhancing protease
MRHACSPVLECHVRPFAPLAAAVVLALGLVTGSHAQQAGLPDIGSSAGELLSPQEEHDYGAYTLYQLRRYGYVLEDPLIDGWLDAMGYRLAAASDRPDQQFTFFVMRDRQINAFATLGGFIGVNAGTILTAKTEDEVAGVVAHEISHVTQKHVLRSVERAKKDQIPIMLATLGVIIAAQQGSNKDSNGNDNSGEAIQAAVIGGQALAAQRQINYTRSSEAEADRVGIQTLFQAGYDPSGMADFFERMTRATRSNSGGYQMPDYLQSHPVSSTRLSEARDRAGRLQREKPAFTTTSSTQTNLLLPWGLSADNPHAAAGPQRMFDWARERMRVLSAENPNAALRESKGIVDEHGPKATDPERYGLALAQSRVGYPAAAEAGFQELAKAHPDNLWIGLALAENANVARNGALSRKRFEELLVRHPDDRATSLSYAEILNSIGTVDAGKRAQAVLRPIMTANADNPLFQKNFGRASELAGDLPRAGEAFAEAAYLNGRAEDALNQLNALLKRDDISYIQRARIEARIAAITPEVMYMQRKRIKPQDLPADQS